MLLCRSATHWIFCNTSEMEETLLKTLLESQQQAFRSALETISRQLQEEVRSLQTTVRELTNSLEFTQRDVDELKNKVKHHETEDSRKEEVIKKLKEDLQASKQHIQDLEERCNYQEDYSRRNNLQIIGIDEQPEETWEQTAVKVSKLLEDKFELPNIELERAHRVGRRDDTRFRPIIARFSRFCDREAVMRNVSKLRGTNIFVNEDLCPASQAIRKAQIPMMKQARRDGKVAFFRHTKLIIKEKTRVPEQEASVVVRGPGRGPAETPNHQTGDGDEGSTRAGALTRGGDVGGDGAPSTSAGTPVCGRVGSDGVSTRGGVTVVETAGAWGSSPAISAQGINSGAEKVSTPASVRAMGRVAEDAAASSSRGGGRGRGRGRGKK